VPATAVRTAVAAAAAAPRMPCAVAPCIGAVRRMRAWMPWAHTRSGGRACSSGVVVGSCRGSRRATCACQPARQQARTCTPQQLA
jgi:hypothetical protein